MTRLVTAFAWIRQAAADPVSAAPDAALLLPVASLLSHACLAPHALQFAHAFARPAAHRRFR